MFNYISKFKFLILEIILLIFLCCSCTNEAPLNPIINESQIPFNAQEQSQADDKQKLENNVSESPRVNMEEMQILEKELIGIWHAAPFIGPGYDNLFYFYSNNRFKLTYSQGDEGKRVIDMCGDWKISEGQLTLSITQKTVIEGGELEEASPSATSKYKIVNGTVVKKQLDIPELERYILGDIEQESDSPYEKKVFIGETPYWKICDDPDDINYINLDELLENNNNNITEDEVYQSILGEWEISGIIQVSTYSVIDVGSLIGKKIKIGETYFVNENEEKKETNIRIFKSDSMELKVAEMIEVDQDSCVYIINLYEGDTYFLTMYYVDGAFWIRIEGHIYELKR